MITTGIANFVHLDQTETYNGQDTGKYSVVLTMEDDEASKLEDIGVKVKEYKNQKQRKFATKYRVPVLTAEGDPFNGRVPFGAKVKVLWKQGNHHPVHGVGVYLEKVKVLEMPEGMDGSEDDEDF